MFKGFFGKDYKALLLAGGLIAAVLLVCLLLPRSLDLLAWVQALAVIIALMLAITVPAMQQKQQEAVAQKLRREREIGYARRLQYFALEFQELLGSINTNLLHLRAADRHRLQLSVQDFLHRLFESHKPDLNEERVVLVHELRQLANGLNDELESGRADRALLQALEARLRKLTQRTQANASMAERG